MLAEKGKARLRAMSDVLKGLMRYAGSRLLSGERTKSLTSIAGNQRGGCTSIEQLNIGRFRRRETADFPLEINQAINRDAAASGGAKINEIEPRLLGVIINALRQEGHWTEVFVSGKVSPVKHVQDRTVHLHAYAGSNHLAPVECPEKEHPVRKTMDHFLNGIVAHRDREVPGIAV